MKCPRCNGYLIKEEDEDICVNCGYRPKASPLPFVGQDELEQPLVPIPVEIDIAEMVRLVNAWKGVNNPEEYKQKYFRPLGRPNTMPQRYCKGCGSPIYPRPYRVKEGGGNYCKSCFNKTFWPPPHERKEISKGEEAPILI